MKHVHVYTLLLMSVFLTSYGQNKTELSNNIKLGSNGLITFNESATSVRTIRQDSKGNILLVSTKGIIRYDGKSFINLTSKISSNRFWDVLEDRKGNLWFASLGSGIYYYDGKSFKNYTTRDGLPSNSVFEIYEDKAGIIWFGTGDGPSRFDGKSFQNFKIKEVPAPAQDSSRRFHQRPPRDPLPYWMVNETNNRVHTILEDQTGKIWFGTWGDVCIYDGKTYTSLTNKYGKTFTNVRTIIEDKKGNIWLDGGGGLLRYDGRTFTKVEQRGVGYMIEDKKGNIWTTGEINITDGIWALSRYSTKSLYNKKPVITEIMLSKNGLFGIFEARDGSIWFSASDGVYRYDGKTVKKL